MLREISMAESQSAFQVAAEKLGVPVNVGRRGGDLPTRYAVAIVLSALTLAMWLGVTFGTLKIGALLIGMGGTILLMAGLVFSQTTHFAGILLVLLPFLMLACTAWGVRWLGIVIGLFFVASTIFNIVTRRCGVNRFLGIVSLDENDACETGF
jgi:hypothetical protein